MAAPHRRWLIERLKQLGLTQADLAKKMGVSKRQVERWCAGAGAYVGNQYDLALALELPAEQVYALFADDGGGPKRNLVIQGEQGADGRYRPVSQQEFYAYYASRIATGRQDIWMTSDGFNLRNQNSRAYAQVMGQAFEAALANGAVVYRYQVTETMHINWIDELQRFKAAYPRQFRIFVNPEVAQVANVCSVDPGSEHCVAEWMEPRTGGFGQGSIASDYSFCLYDRARARDTQDVVQQEIDASTSLELSLSGLEQLKAQLFAQRATQLRQWCATQDPEVMDIADSGVFDERVISRFVMEASGAQEAQRTG